MKNTDACSWSEIFKINHSRFYTMSQKRTNFEMVSLKIRRIDFDDIAEIFKTSRSGPAAPA